MSDRAIAEIQARRRKADEDARRWAEAEGEARAILVATKRQTHEETERRAAEERERRREVYGRGLQLRAEAYREAVGAADLLDPVLAAWAAATAKASEARQLIGDGSGQFGGVVLPAEMEVLMESVAKVRKRMRSRGRYAQVEHLAAAAAEVKP